MGLFDRRAGKGAPFDWLVVGLGNPGPKYERTRHNVGEEVVRLLAERHDAPLKAGRDNSLIGEARFTVGGDTVRAALAFPLTYVNDSGRAVSSLVRRYRIESPEQIIVVQDELDLEPGVVRLKSGGGLAGHNGLRSVKQALGSADFLRVRVGVGRPGRGDRRPVADYVLSPFAAEEDGEALVARAADAVETLARDGLDEAQRRFN
jgi:PTH1 family peptidyl-tRNA hydrolase